MKTKKHALDARESVSMMFTLGLALGISQGMVSREAQAEDLGPTREMVRVDLVHSSGFSPKSMEKLRSALDVVENVLSSEEFRQSVINFTYDGKNAFANNDGLTNHQIYSRIMAAKETYSAVEDYVAQLDLNLYTPPWYKKWSVVGYTYPNQPPIYMNWYYFNSFTPQQIAGNVAHEWTHKIGFTHDYGRTARRPYSVPYAVGDMVIKLSSRYLP